MWKIKLAKIKPLYLLISINKLGISTSKQREQTIKPCINKPGISMSKQREQSMKRNNGQTKTNRTTAVILEIETLRSTRRGLSGHHTRNMIANVYQADRRDLDSKI